MAPQDKIPQWKADIERIVSDTMDTIESQYIFKRLVEIVSANPNINTDNLFWDHMRANFGASLLLGITRQVDVRPEVVSLIKLLRDIRDNSNLVTKSWFADQYTTTLPREIGEHDFAEHFGTGPELDSAIVGQDIQNLSSATSKIAKFRHTRIAHKNTDERLVIDLNFLEVEDALAVVEKLVTKYYLLLNQGGFTQLMPVIQYDWESVFRTAWIPQDS